MKVAGMFVDIITENTFCCFGVLNDCLALQKYVGYKLEQGKTKHYFI
jgi:hypothetical protein